MQIKLNGKIVDTIKKPIKTLTCLLAELNINPGAVYIKKNGSTIRVSKIGQTTIEEKDNIELITLVAGG